MRSVGQRMPASVCKIHDCNLQYDGRIVMLYCPECRAVLDRELFDAAKDITALECEDCYGTGKKHTQDNSMLDDPCKVCGGSGQKRIVRR